ncbi:unnamed protein product [Vitrella brassicaformis CCMP3155]|uniref:Uncharacterized protein n=1 Tax=Vitrella brassicaformis (strain CCMP3155) TaxID=1169540 RepID=A0A0G4FBD2_VITBC|nr:unnamed protein product [Vitrella brassicaformis CCMP3155]|eukprot:CEM10205.1 unnamed protein product [Vitrella brassicaformis CCMP3155]
MFDEDTTTICPPTASPSQSIALINIWDHQQPTGSCSGTAKRKRDTDTDTGAEGVEGEGTAKHLRPAGDCDNHLGWGDRESEMAALQQMLSWYEEDGESESSEGSSDDSSSEEESERSDTDGEGELQKGE